MTDTANKYADSRNEDYDWLFGHLDIPAGMWLELRPNHYSDLGHYSCLRYELILMDSSGPLEAVLVYPSEDRGSAKEMIGDPIPSFLVWMDRKKKLENNRRKVIDELGF